MAPLFLRWRKYWQIHAQQIEFYGGSDGVRDAAGLESAVATPMATFGGQFLHPTIPAMGAAYLFHLCDWELDNEDELVDLVLAVASGKMSKSARKNPSGSFSSSCVFPCHDEMKHPLWPGADAREREEAQRRKRGCTDCF